MKIGMEIPTMAQQVARVVIAQHEHQTGRTPASVTVALNESSLAITLHEVLSPAERVMAKYPDGAIRVQEVQRLLFINSCDVLREEIKRIMGLEIEEGSTEVQASTGTVIHTLGTINAEHNLLPAHVVSWDSWSGS